MRRSWLLAGALGAAFTLGCEMKVEPTDGAHHRGTGGSGVVPHGHQTETQERTVEEREGLNVGDISIGNRTQSTTERRESQNRSSTQQPSSPQQAPAQNPEQNPDIRIENNSSTTTTESRQETRTPEPAHPSSPQGPTPPPGG